MIIFMINILRNSIPQIMVLANSLVALLAYLSVFLIGITLLCAAVGVPIGRNLLSTLFSGCFRALAYIVNMLVRALGWLIRNIIRFIPRLYRGSRQLLNDIGLTPRWSAIFSLLITILFIIFII